MKTIPVCPILSCALAIACCAWSSTATAEDRAADIDPKKERQQHPKPGEMWNKVDLNGDGAISRDEFAQMPRLAKLPEEKRQALFDRLDKNGDARIEPSEMHQGRPGGHDHRPQMPRIWELDKNRDGGVSFEEFVEGPMVQRLEPDKQKRIFNRLDANGDGQISPDDKPKRRPRPENGEGGAQNRPDRGPARGGPGQPDKPGPRGLIEHLDKDGDGEVTLEEFSANPRMQKLDPETLRKRYQMLDRNRDGKVDRSDIRRPKPIIE